MVNAAAGAIIWREVNGRGLRGYGEVLGFDISVMPPGPLGIDSLPPILLSNFEVVILCLDDQSQSSSRGIEVGAREHRPANGDVRHRVGQHVQMAESWRSHVRKLQFNTSGTAGETLSVLCLILILILIARHHGTSAPNQPKPHWLFLQLILSLA